MSAIPVLHRYDEVFRIEIDGWCFGISNYPGEVSPSIIHRVVRELASPFQAAIEHNVVIDILAMADKISQSAKGLVHPQEIAMSMISQLPNPAILSEDQQCVLGQIIDKVDRSFPGALDNFYGRWNLGVRSAA